MLERIRNFENPEGLISEKIKHLFLNKHLFLLKIWDMLIISEWVCLIFQKSQQLENIGGWILMTDKELDILLKDIKIRLLKLKEYRDIGIPIRKLRENTNYIKINLMKWIKNQRSRNLSYQQIRRKLRSEGILTLSGRPDWDPRTISKIEKGKY